MMKQRAGRRAACMVAAGLLMSACSDTTSSVDDQVLLDMAIVSADAVIEDHGSWARPFGFGGIPSLDGERRGRPGGHHGIGDALSGTTSEEFFDADGNAQSAYDETTTATIHFVSEVAGEVGREQWSASIARERAMTVTGLAGAETHRTFNGTGSEQMSSVRASEEGGARSHEMSGSFRYADVVVPIPGSEPRYPVSGTVSRDMTAVIVNGPNGDETRSATVVITFDGDETATLVVDGEEMEIDLTAREGRHALRGRPGGRFGGFGR